MDRRWKALVEKLAASERALVARTFLAPALCGGRVTAFVDGLRYTFTLAEREFEGWGVFRPVDALIARLEAPAGQGLVAQYLHALGALRLVAIGRLIGRTWLAYPVNESDMFQRLGGVGPVCVHLVDAVDAFDRIVVRHDGRNFWFESEDRSADPRLAEALRAAKAQGLAVDALAISGLTPELRAAYEISAAELAPWAPGVSPAATLQEARRAGRARRAQARRDREELRVRDALAWAGGALEDVRERGDAWLISWRDRGGNAHGSLIRKSDLEVVSAGVCLSGMDAAFDVQSLVSVMEEYADA